MKNRLVGRLPARRGGMLRGRVYTPTGPRVQNSRTNHHYKVISRLLSLVEGTMPCPSAPRTGGLFLLIVGESSNAGSGNRDSPAHE